MTGKWLLVAAFATPLALLAGCSRNGTTDVKGRVLHNGRPVTGGYVTFAPVAEDGDPEPGKPSAAAVRADGSFTAKDVVSGKLRIVYSPPVVELPAGVELKEGQSMPATPFDHLVPSEAEVEVKSGALLDIELVPGPGWRPRS